MENQAPAALQSSPKAVFKSPLSPMGREVFREIPQNLNAAANQASQADQPVTNDSPNSAINSVASKNSKISDDSSDSSLDYGSANEDSASTPRDDSLIHAFNDFNLNTPKSVKKHQKEPLFLTPHEDPQKPDFQNSPVGVKWPDDNSVLINEPDLLEPVSVVHEDSLPLRKQKVFNILTESFETPDSSIIGDLNLSALLNVRDRCEVGQDPLSISAETDVNLNLGESNHFHQNVSELLSAVSEDNTVSNVSYILNKTTDGEPCNGITKDDIDNGNFEIAQDEGIAIVNSDEREEIFKASEIYINDLEDNDTFSLDSKILNTSDFLHKDHELESVSKLNKTFDRSISSATMSNSENGDSELQNLFVLSNSMHLNNGNSVADISNNLVEHMKEISDVRNSINNLLASANNSLHLNESSNNAVDSISQSENIDSEGIAVIDENSNKSVNISECLPTVDQSNSFTIRNSDEACRNISENDKEELCNAEENKIELEETIQSSGNSMPIMDVTLNVTTTEEIQTSYSPEKLDLNQSHNSSAGLLDPSFINEADSIIDGKYDGDEPMDCDFELSYVIQANQDVNLPFVDTIGTITQQIDLVNPLETNTNITNTPERLNRTSTLSHSIVVEGTNSSFDGKPDHCGDTSEPMECDESFITDTAMKNIILNNSSPAPNNYSMDVSGFGTRANVFNSPVFEKPLEGNHSLTEANGFGLRANNSPAADNIADGNNLSMEASGFTTRANVCNSPVADNIAEINNLSMEASGFTTRANVCNSPVADNIAERNNLPIEASGFTTRANVCNSPVTDNIAEINNLSTEASGFTTRANVCNSPVADNIAERNNLSMEASGFVISANVCNSPAIEKIVEGNNSITEVSGFDTRANVQNSPLQVIEQSLNMDTNEPFIEADGFITKSNVCNSPAKGYEIIPCTEINNSPSEVNGFETKSNIFNTPVKNASGPSLQEGVIPEAVLSELMDNLTPTKEVLVSNGMDDVEAINKSLELNSSNENMGAAVTITISAPSPEDPSKNLPKHEEICTVNGNSIPVVEASSNLNMEANTTFETDKATEQSSGPDSFEIKTIDASLNSTEANHFNAHQNLNEAIAILNGTEVLPNELVDNHLMADQALDEACDILENLNISIPIVQRTEAEINATFNGDFSMSHGDPSEVTFEVQSNPIISEELNSIISKSTELVMDNTFEVKDNIETTVGDDESNVPSDEIKTGVADIEPNASSSDIIGTTVGDDKPIVPSDIIGTTVRDDKPIVSSDIIETIVGENKPNVPSGTNETVFVVGEPSDTIGTVVDDNEPNVPSDFIESIIDDNEPNVPLGIIESDILDNDLDGLESDSDTISACSSVPSEFNPFETRCKIKNTPDREMDTTITVDTNVSEIESPLESTLVIEQKAIVTEVKKVASQSMNQMIKKSENPANKPDNVAQLMTDNLTDDRCNDNISSFNMSIANGDFVKNSTNFKNNLERINDVSPENIETTPKSTNVARSDSCKLNTSDHTFASPVPRRVNQLSKRNAGVKVQKVKNLSPMSRCGDLMGMSPVSHDDDERESPQDRPADFLTGDSNFQYSHVIDDDMEDEFKMPGEYPIPLLPNLLRDSPRGLGAGDQTLSSLLQSFQLGNGDAPPPIPPMRLLHQLVFKDPAAFDYLLSCGSGGGRDLCKESLLVRFDPLVAGGARQLPTGARPGRQVPPPPPKLEEDASTASGLAESCSSDSSLCTSNSDPAKTLGTMSSVDQSMSALSLQSQGNQQHSAANCSTPPSVASNVLNVTSQPTEKPTQVVTPAISTRQQQQYLPSTPLSSKNPQTPAKSVTSALAAIDRLISLGGTPPPPPVVVQPKEPDMDPRLMAELQSVRELFSHQEEELRHTNESMSALQKQLNDAIAREQALIDRVNEKNRDHRQMDIVMEEYERTMSQFIGDRESEKRQWAEERAALIRERDEANSHLANMEHSFNDIHAKYERCKQLVQGYKNNEEGLKEEARLNDEATKKQAERYEQLRQHAMSQLETANAEIESLKKSSSSEVIKLQAMLKKSDIQVASLQESLLQKVKDIEDLTAICDDLIQKVG